MSELAADPFDATRPWGLSPEVSLRNESFGALAYHHGNRRLIFVKSPTLATLVTRLDEFASADDALDEIVAPGTRVAHERALGSLAESGIIRGR